MRNGTTRLGALNLGNGKVGAGGFTTGFSIAADGKKMVRTDTWNAYMCPVGVSGQWAPELRPGINCNVADIDIFYGGDPHPWGQCGTYDVAIAPSNSSVRYMVCMGYVWVTQDDGASWTRCALSQKASCRPNETNRMSGKPLAVDPQNPAFVFFGSPQGVQYSTDYGANWTAISTGTIPAPTNDGSGNTIGRTTDKGLTWSSNGILRDLSGNTGGGCIVKFDANRWVTFQTNRATPLAGNAAKNGIYRTNDAGATWTLCTIGDNEALNFHSAYNLCRRTLIGDKKTSGVAYALNMGDNSGSASDLACKGIWKTIDYGVTWTRVKNGFITSFAADFYHAKFTQGASANEWYFCGGDECLGLWRSTDGMATWSQVTGTDDIIGAASFGEVFGVGVGKPAQGSAYPTLLAAGWRMTSPTGASSATGYGFWISYDNGATWTRVALFPSGIFDIVNDIAGDPTTFGRFYVGWGGTGMSMLSYDYSMSLT